MDDTKITPETTPAQGEPEILPGAIDWKKPVRTKSRKIPARIFVVDPTLRQPVVGRLLEEGDNDVYSWSLSGVFQSNGQPGSLDLENYEPEAKGPRISDERLARFLATSDSVGMDREIALDLRDARVELAALQSTLSRRPQA